MRPKTTSSPQKPKKPRGRPVTRTMAESIPDTPPNILKAILLTPPKKNQEWDYLKQQK